MPEPATSPSLPAPISPIFNLPRAAGARLSPLPLVDEEDGEPLRAMGSEDKDPLNVAGA